jgi:CelD/BcsL family acetyltransferase involved in cellulose biosynthesis
MPDGAGYIAETVAPGAWDALVERFDDHTVFHTWPWLESVRREHGLRAELVQVRDAASCVAVWPCLMQRKGPFRILGSPLPGWSTPYLGPLIAPDADVHAVFETFLRRSSLRRWSYMNCRVFDKARDVDLERHGFTRGRREETYLIDLEKPEETIWAGLKGSCRSRVRKARRLGLTVREEPDLTFIDQFWEMAREVFAKYGIDPNYSHSLLRSVCEGLRKAGRLYAVSAFDDDKRVGTLILPYDDHCMYYWAGAAFDADRSVPYGNLLHWEAMMHARAMGLRTYDFVNVSDNGGGGQFKRSFGPQRVAVATHWEASRSKLIAALKERYKAHLLRRRRIGA